MNTPDNRSRPIRLAPFAIAFICFLLPFVEVSCQGKTAAKLTGIEAALGADRQQRDEFTGQTRTQHIEGTLAFQLALGCVVGGVVLAFLPSVFGLGCTAVAGVAGVVALWVGKQNFDQMLQAKGGGMFVPLWQAGFFGATFCLLVGALVAALQANRASQSPPKTD